MGHAGANTVQASSAAGATHPTGGFVPLRIKRVIHETTDAVSLVLDVPPSSAELFGYQAGQFITLRVQIAGREHRRCYSMSSSPATGEDLRITVKRDRDGVVSNWLNDYAEVGDRIQAAPPAGRFVLRDSGRELVAFAGGSGITPVFSLIRSALASGTRPVSLFYANRNRGSVIFAEPLALLAERHPHRLVIQHHLDEHEGVVQPAQVESFCAPAGDAEFYICGPGPFMDTVEAAVLKSGASADRVHLERFQVAEIPVPAPDAAASVTEHVTFELDRRKTVVPYRSGNTLLQTARLGGLRAPSSCETGSCGTCMAMVVEGSARMLNNDALDEAEVADGWVLTCQSLPTSPTVTVIYE
ncbi:MAG TPA: ferredoxin--NADP reductase [Mycobacterium sp.]|nr:ferredoxin--NADP reductase [Mycobacterium sp.]